MNYDDLSPKAQELVDLTGGQKALQNERDTEQGSEWPSVQDVLRDRPDLVDGLDEYQRWRDIANRMISCSECTHSVQHPLSSLLHRRG